MPSDRFAARTFRDLLVWCRAHEFVLAAYAITVCFPKDETYGLSSQLRRAAVSIAAKIAEGFRQRGKADKTRFMNISEGSIEECRYYSILAQNLGYSRTESIMETLEEVSRLLNAYTARIQDSVS